MPLRDEGPCPPVSRGPSGDKENLNDVLLGFGGGGAACSCVSPSDREEAGWCTHHRPPSPTESHQPGALQPLFAASSMRGTAQRVSIAQIWRRKMKVCVQPLCGLQQVILPSHSCIHFTSIHRRSTCRIWVCSLETQHQIRPAMVLSSWHFNQVQ